MQPVPPTRRFIEAKYGAGSFGGRGRVLKPMIETIFYHCKYDYMEIQLLRQYHANGTNGVLLLDGKKIGYTIELPWRNNQRRISCIPEGRYRIRKRYTMRFGWHCLVENVTGRDMILIHAFNDALKESKGCIAPVTAIEGPGRGSSSRAALKKFMSLVSQEFDQLKPVYLTIKKDDHEHDSQKSTKADTKVL